MYDSHYILELIKFLLNELFQKKYDDRRNDGSISTITFEVSRTDAERLLYNLVEFYISK